MTIQDISTHASNILETIAFVLVALACIASAIASFLNFHFDQLERKEKNHKPIEPLSDYEINRKEIVKVFLTEHEARSLLSSTGDMLQMIGNDHPRYVDLFYIHCLIEDELNFRTRLVREQAQAAIKHQASPQTNDRDLPVYGASAANQR